jgi:hypothetical protein
MLPRRLVGPDDHEYKDGVYTISPVFLDGFLARHGLHITPIMVSLVEDAVTVAGVSTSSTTEDNLQTLP